MKRVLILLILVFQLFLSASGVNANGVETINVGLVVAEDITSNEDGLIIIDGLFSISTFEKFPAVDDFKIYTRWIGSGKQVIKVQILDEEDNIVMDSDGVALEFDKDYSTYYQYFDFNNIVFTKPGIYRIQALIDNKVAREIPLFIEASEEELEFENAPKLPALILSCPADSVTEKENNLQVISGVFEYFTSKRFPFAYDFIIANVWHSGDGEYSQYIELIDPDGKIIYSSEPQSFAQGPKTVNVIYDKLEDIIFFKAGTYRVRVYLDDKVVSDYPVLVVPK
jgi:hypothetical protein